MPTNFQPSTRKTPGGHDIYEIGGMEFVKVPAGAFIMGSKDDDAEAYRNEKPQHTVDIPYDYWMARFSITNAQFAQFAKTGNYQLVEGKSEHPVYGISWKGAIEFCKLANEAFRADLQQAGNLVLRLPGEAEWEKAARGVDGNIYPWGNEAPDARRCNFDMNVKDTMPVDAYPDGASPYGCEQMAGNVWEWTHTLFKMTLYQAGDGREDEEKPGARVLRGGAYNLGHQYMRCAYRYGDNTVKRDGNGGFRVCVAPVLSSDNPMQLSNQ